MSLLRVVCGILSVLLVISLVGALYAGIALTIITDYDFYMSEFEKNGIYGNFGDKSQPPLLAQGLVSYFKDGSNLPPDIPQFDISESLHLRDVKLIVLRLRSVFYFCSFLMVANLVSMIVFFRGNLARNLHKLLLFSGISIISIDIILALLSLSFSTTFILFHKIFFPQGNWQFPAESTLIRLFPQQFFLDAFLRIVLRAGFFGLLLLIMGILLSLIRKNYKIPLQIRRYGQT